MRNSPLIGVRLAAGLVAGAMALLCQMAGCGSGPMVEGAVYPETAKQVRVVDIQVTREETDITFTNTTAHSIPGCRMWVNRWWSLELPPVGVGETVKLDLRSFKDRYGEPFRGGGFFATEPPDPLVAAQFEIGGEMVGLVVIGG